MRRALACYLALAISVLSFSPVILAQTYTPTAFELALFYFSFGRWERVTSELNNALKEDNNDPELLTFIGAFLSALGDESQANTFLQKAEKSKASPGVYVIQGDIYRRLKNNKKAEEFYKKALVKQPKSVMAYIGIGKVKEQESKLEEALGFYNKALELNPQRVETLLSAGKVEYSLKRYEAATTHFQNAVELDPATADNHLWYAKSLFAIGSVEKGLQQLERTLELDESLNEALELQDKWQTQ